jgi:lipid-A-disaccharide synthase
MAQRHILIICGEASGDLHAANLARKILEIDPEIKISAVGGENLRQAGAQIYCDIKDLSCLGFFDVLRKLPKFFALQKFLLEKIQQEKPKRIILVDFSGFNLRLAKKISKSIPTIYYISPQVWASRAGRVNTIKKYIDKMVVIFKFEEDFYRKYGVDVNFISHPLLDIVKPSMEKKEFLNNSGLSASKTTLCLLPGSRKSEVEKILPTMVGVVSLVSQNINVQCVIAKSSEVDWNIYNKLIQRAAGVTIKVIEGKTYDCLNIADFALVASGTATLETAILEKPFVVIYKMGLLNYLFYRPQLKVPYIGMVNIVANKLIIPEFIQFQASAKRIAKTVIKLLKNPSELEGMKNDLGRVKSLLGETGATYRAAKIIVNSLS